jgi:hypothetical protein
MFFRGGIEQVTTMYHLVVIQILAIGPCSRLLSKRRAPIGANAETIEKSARYMPGSAKTCGHEEKFSKE